MVALLKPYHPGLIYSLFIQSPCKGSGCCCVASPIARARIDFKAFANVISENSIEAEQRN